MGRVHLVKIINMGMIEFVMNVVMDRSRMNARHISETYENGVVELFQYS